MLITFQLFLFIYVLKHYTLIHQHLKWFLVVRVSEKRKGILSSKMLIFFLGFRSFYIILVNDSFKGLSINIYHTKEKTSHLALDCLSQNHHSV